LDAAVPEVVRPWLACPFDGSADLRWDAAGATCGRCAGHAPVRDGVWEAMGGRRAPSTPAQLVNRLPPVARRYESWWRVRSLGLLAGRPLPIGDELADLVAAVGPVDGVGVVDLACSEGLYGRALAARGAQVLAVDHSRAFLRRVAARAATGAGTLVPVRALAQHLPVRDDAVAAVVIGGSLNEIGDQRAALAESARVLRPGGRLCSMSLVRATGRAGRLLQGVLRPSGVAFPSLDETLELLPAGLRPLDVRVDGIVLRLTAGKGG
jgi:SAM-dependent methyltransferase